MFFCQPFRYPRLCKKWNLIIIIGITSIIAFSYVIYTELTIGRKIAYMSFTCQLMNPKQSHIQTTVFVFIPLVISIFCVISINRVLAKQRMRIRHIALEVNPQMNNASQINPIKQLIKNGGKTIRLIVMVSGTFLASLLPSTIFRETVLMNGITWDDIITRRVYWAAILMRLEVIIGSVTFSCVNPIIYFYIEKVFYQELKARLTAKTGSPISSDINV